MGVTITTNWHRREVTDGWSVPAEVRAEFDYIDWEAIENGTDSASFVFAYGRWFDLGDTEGNRFGDRMPDSLSGWDAYVSDTFFSGTVFRWVQDDPPYSDDWLIIVGRYFAGSDSEGE
jgi:hypothetical protein